MALTREQILELDDTRVKSVHVDAWGGEVFIKLVSGRVYDMLTRDLRKAAEEWPADLRAKACAQFICDENGHLLFNQADIGKLSAKCGNALDQIMNEGILFNRLLDDESAIVEQEEKNSEPMNGAVSGTG